MMLKQLTLAAFALTAVSAFAGENWESVDPMTASNTELKKFVIKHAYKTVSAGDAYTIASFVNGLPGNVQNAVLKGLAQNAVQAKTIQEENQMAANSMGPAGDGAMAEMPKKDWSNDSTSDSSRPMRMFSEMKQPAELSYENSIKILSSGLGAIDQGLIFGLFTPVPFTRSMVPTVMNEKAIDAITRQIQANAKWTEPYRLKYTSLAPRAAYVSPMIPR